MLVSNAKQDFSDSPSPRSTARIAFERLLSCAYTGHAAGAGAFFQSRGGVKLVSELDGSLPELR
jgi:hypothetical protein